MPWPRGISKFGNKKTNGYDSKREYQRSLELKALQESGDISNLQEQVPFVVIEKQQGEREAKYKADFTYYTKDGQFVVEDVKGMKTPEYILKRKLMLKVHGIRIVEVK